MIPRDPSGKPYFRIPKAGWHEDQRVDTDIGDSDVSQETTQNFQAKTAQPGNPTKHPARSGDLCDDHLAGHIDNEGETQ